MASRRGKPQCYMKVTVCWAVRGLRKPREQKLRKLLELALALLATLTAYPALACDDDSNIRTARLALPSDEALNVFDAGGVTMVAPGECSGGLYAISYPSLLAKAKAGDVAAMDYVGLMLSAGAGVKQDWKAAVKWLEKAAVEGSGEANYRLGIINQYGLGQEIDLAAAIERYAIASGKSVAFGSTNLGMMHFQGIGTPKNLTEAVRFFELAHEQGDHFATQNLASIFAQGMEGIPRNEERAFILAGQAARKSNTPAMRLLGFFYANGLGTSKDIRKAYIWAKLAAQRGDGPGGQLVSRIQPLLSPEQLADVANALEVCVESDFNECAA